MPINQLHGTLQHLLLQLRPAERITRIRNFSRLLVGLCLSRCVYLSKTPTKAPLPPAPRRLSRLLDNAAIRVRDWYEPIARSLLERAAAQGGGGGRGGGEIRLIVDGSKVGSKHRLLMVGLAYRRRAIPIAWSWVRSEKGHSSAYKQRALLGYVWGLVPDGARVSVLGDNEFGAVALMKQLEEWGWYYVLRQKCNHLVREEEEEEGWEPMGELIQRAGQTRWMENVFLSRLHAHRTNLVLHWKRGQKEPWLLATNLMSSREALSAYKKRMWIEELFADLKGHGFDLESTRLRRFGRLSRLTLAVAMLYVWLVVYGAEVVKRGQRRLVDRSDRRDHSLFRLGYNMLDRCLAQGVRPFIRLLPSSLPKLSGG